MCCERNRIRPSGKTNEFLLFREKIKSYVFYLQIEINVKTFINIVCTAMTLILGLSRTKWNYRTNNERDIVMLKNNKQTYKIVKRTRDRVWGRQIKHTNVITNV